MNEYDVHDYTRTVLARRALKDDGGNTWATHFSLVRPGEEPGPSAYHARWCEFIATRPTELEAIHGVRDMIDRQRARLGIRKMMEDA